MNAARPASASPGPRTPAREENLSRSVFWKTALQQISTGFRTAAPGHHIWSPQLSGCDTVRRGLNSLARARGHRAGFKDDAGLSGVIARFQSCTLTLGEMCERSFVPSVPAPRVALCDRGDSPHSCVVGCALGTPTSSVATCQQQEGLTVLETRQVLCSCVISGMFLNFRKLPSPHLAGVDEMTCAECPHLLGAPHPQSLQRQETRAGQLVTNTLLAPS